jgi:site-specific DNA recombinase
VDRRQELAGLSRSIEDFCERIRTGLQQATFDQKRKLVELLIDRVIVSDGEVEVRYVMPTCKNSEQIRFCHLQLDYRARSSPREVPAGNDARFQVFPQCANRDRWH